MWCKHLSYDVHPTLGEEMGDPRCFSQKVAKQDLYVSLLWGSHALGGEREPLGSQAGENSGFLPVVFILLFCAISQPPLWLLGKVLINLC